MDMNHLIGQRFNLISKSDIRYVGTLHEINPEASTIALENVVSFGTEGRRGNPNEEIPPSASVYEYIVFRGSDVKDISVAEEQKETAQPEPPQVPDDPAILGSMSRPGPGPQGLPPRSQPLPQQPQASHPAPPGYPPQQAQFQGLYLPYAQRFGAPGFPPGPGFPNMPYGAPPGWYPPPGQGFLPGPGQFPQMPMGGPGPHQTPPPQNRAGAPGAGPVNAPKPTSELPAGDRPTSKPSSRNATPAPAPSAQNPPPPPVESKPSVTEAVQASTSAQIAQAAALGAGPGSAAKAPPTGPRSGRVQPAIPIAMPFKPPGSAVANSTASAPVNNASQGPALSAITEATRAATAAVAAAMAKLPQPNAQKKPQLDAAVESVTKQMNELKTYEGGRPPRGGHRGGRSTQRGQFQGPAKKVEVPDTDYDFEGANAKFNKQDLVKEAIATGSPVLEAEPHVQTDHAEVADTTSNDASTGAAIAYNRTTSFFDNISSEARDREEGTGGRPGGREWRGQEEKRNIETFGQGSVDGYRGNYRGRGRGRGYSGRGRGGYGRGYNPRGRGGNYRGRSTTQSTGVPAPI
ncbi:putative G2/M phase checkpoint control protein Sum2 [Aspergillus clavatus NRRL 1]|uniref:G2/M phase checkpoint control protein Sum2, putative n=1 Tax=Aspergillus clavatus (strain ATCC 1007 / CBS 513.65 / DSM 816 / NCTC 3887 / NRRL 1 / QM 1276 / 107) TaxID=344612 RepID=A1CPM4_ASPCL|nr:G2/M phase checkpoint control protein Sum2, putative [Aspergillus clavatus NRRL 1]EAW07595.1 G2/M phase checkpoint control protein Sum2, putative [Aspergillus clavatus NRRL 1]